MVTRLIILALLMHTAAPAQEWIDEDATGPMLDAVEQYRDAPLSLHTATVADLQTIPGFTRNTAARIRATFRRDTTLTLEQIADTLCLAPSQRALLHVCCTRARLAPALLRSVACRMRLSDAVPWTRLNATTTHGSVSVLSRGAWRGGSVHAFTSDADLVLGSLTMSSGMGLLLGAPIFLGKGASLDAPSRWTDALISPWRSTPSANVLEGIAVRSRFAVSDIPCSFAAMSARHENGAARAGIVSITPSDGMTTSFTVVDDDDQVGISSSARTQVGALTFGTEVAIRTGVAASAMLQWTSSASTVVLAARHLPATWMVPTAAPFADGNGRNETGLFAGIRARFSGWSTTAWLDVFRTHAAPHLMPAPRSTAELFVETEKRVGIGTWLTVRCRYEGSTQRATSDTTDRTISTERQRVYARVALTHTVTPDVDVRLQTAVQHAGFDRHREQEHSWMCSAEIRYMVANVLRIAMKCQTYEGASLQSAIYSFDHRVPGSFGSVPLLGTGARWMISATWQPLDVITVSCAAMSDGRSVLQLDLFPLAR